jgi:hypothetical protein
LVWVCVLLVIGGVLFEVLPCVSVSSCLIIIHLFLVVWVVLFLPIAGRIAFCLGFSSVFRSFALSCISLGFIFRRIVEEETICLYRMMLG